MTFRVGQYVRINTNADPNHWGHTFEIKRVLQNNSSVSYVEHRSDDITTGWWLEKYLDRVSKLEYTLLS